MTPAPAPIITDAEFSRQYEEHYNYSVRLLRQQVGCKWDIEALVQDGWLLAWKHRDQYRRESAFLTWVNRIIYNQFLAAARRKRHETLTLYEVPEPMQVLDYEPAILLDQILSRTPPDSSRRLLMEMEGEVPLPVPAYLRVRLYRDRRLVQKVAQPKLRRQALMRMRVIIA